MTNSWTESEISTAAQMWATGFSAREIGARLDRPRNSVCGLAFRKRDLFPSRPQPENIPRSGRPPSMEPKPKQVRKSVPALERILPPVRFRVKVEKPKRETVTAPPMAPDCAPVAFLYITDTQCKFPLWSSDHRPGPDSPCCGSKIDFGAVYCAYHKRLTTKVLPEKPAQEAPKRFDSI